MKQESSNLVTNVSSAQTPTGQNTGAMWSDFSRIIGDFVGFRYIDRLNADIRVLFQELKHDYQTSQWFTDLRNFIEDSLRRPETLESDDNLHYAEDLWNRGRIVSQKWAHHDVLQKTIKDVQKLFSKFANDPLVGKTVQDVGRLTSDMFLHPSGGLSIGNTMEGIRALKYILVPLLVDQLENLPLPRIEGSSRKYSYVFDNMVLAGRSILPENVDVQVLSDNKINLAADPTTRSSFELILTLSNLNLFMKDVAFFIQKKKGFPKLKDEGLVDILVTGGINFLVLRWVVQADRGRPLYFRLANVTSHITRVKPTFTSARHKGMLNAMTSMSAGALRNRVNFTIEERIIAFFDKLDARLNEMAAMRWENSRVSWLKRPIRVPKTGGFFSKAKATKDKVKQKTKEKKTQISQGQSLTPYAQTGGVVGATQGMEQGISQGGVSPSTMSTGTTDLGHAQPHVFVGSGVPSDSSRGLHIIPQRSQVVTTPFSTTDELAPVASSNVGTSSFPSESFGDKQLTSKPSEIDIGTPQQSGLATGTGSRSIPSTSDVPSSETGGFVVDSPRTMQPGMTEPINKSFTKQEELPPSSFQVAPSSSS
jgi:hypothetical protein